MQITVLFLIILFAVIACIKRRLPTTDNLVVELTLCILSLCRSLHVGYTHSGLVGHAGVNERSHRCRRNAHTCKILSDILSHTTHIMTPARSIDPISVSCRPRDSDAIRVP